jgi:general secretion pathway protein G
MNNRSKKASIQRAFTLVEMMAVVVIIGILAAVIAPRFFGQVNKAQVVRAEKDIETLKQAITLYKFDTNRFPTELRDLVVEPDDARNWNGPYLESKKDYTDPWSNPYEYRVPGLDNRDFDLWSYGQDEKEGGEGLDRDITSWEQDDF